MSAFTPGPWHVDYIAHDGRFMAVAPHAWPEGGVAAASIATTPAAGIGPFAHQREANAYLIAAAPDLYEFARAVFADKSAYQWHVAAQVVLRKAEGAV